MPVVRSDALHGHWVHSHEEDSDDEMVFRPAGHPFPPARGRMGFELRADGTYVERSPGPVDVPVAAIGSWSLDGDRLSLVSDDRQPNRVWRVRRAEGDRLVVKA